MPRLTNSGFVSCDAQAVHSEMTAFLPLLWSEINGVRSLNPTVMRCDIYTTNTERDATDPEPVYRQQVPRNLLNQYFTALLHGNMIA